MAEPNSAPVQHSARRTVGVALAVCLVCSLFVTSAAVMLRPIQIANQVKERQRVLVELAGLTALGLSIESAYRLFDVNRPGF